MNNNNYQDQLYENNHETSLPYPWVQEYSEEYQIYYYLNTVTGETTWDSPVFSNDNDYQEGNNNSYEDYNDIDDDYNFNNDNESSNQYQYDSNDNNDYASGSQSVGTSSVGNRVSGSNVVERSNNMLMAKQLRTNAIKAELEQQDIKDIQPNPVINKRSKGIHRTVDDMMQWEEQRKAKVQQLRAQARQREDAEIRGKPQITQEAHRLAASRQYDNMDDDRSRVSASTTSSRAVPVQERLLDYENQRRLRQQQRIAQQRNEAKARATPKLNPRSANYQRKTTISSRSIDDNYSDNYTIDTMSDQLSVGERLYYQHQQVRSDDHSSDARPIIRDQTTGQLLFQPKISQASEIIAARARPQVRVEDLLQYHGKVQDFKHDQMLKKEEEKLRALREAPKVNAISEKLVQERYIVHGETTQDRLHQPIGKVKEKTLQTIDQPTFKPTISKVSQEIAAGSGNRLRGEASTEGLRFHVGGKNVTGSRIGAGDVSAVLLNDDNYRYFQYDDSFDTDNSNNNSQSGPLLYEDLVNNISKKNSSKDSADQSNKINNNNRYHDNPKSNNNKGKSTINNSNSSVNIYDKSQRWNQLREQRLERERKERERQELAQCSFKPKIDNTKLKLQQNWIEDSNNNNSNKLSIADRQLEWLKQREQKLELERQRKHEEEIEDCTFAPNTARQTSITDSNNNTDKSNPVNFRSGGHINYLNSAELHEDIEDHDYYPHGDYPTDGNYDISNPSNYDNDYGGCNDRGSSGSAPKRIPLPIKSRGTTNNSTSNILLKQAHAQQTIRVQDPSHMASTSNYVHYQPSPTSGVMLAIGSWEQSPDSDNRNSYFSPTLEQDNSLHYGNNGEYVNKNDQQQQCNSNISYKGSHCNSHEYANSYDGYADNYDSNNQYSSNNNQEQYSFSALAEPEDDEVAFENMTISQVRDYYRNN